MYVMIWLQLEFANLIYQQEVACSRPISIWVGGCIVLPAILCVCTSRAQVYFHQINVIRALAPSFISRSFSFFHVCYTPLGSLALGWSRARGQTTARVPRSHCDLGPYNTPEKGYEIVSPMYENYHSWNFFFKTRRLPRRFVQNYC